MSDKQKKENIVVSLLCNIILPILILNYLSHPLGPRLALIIGLSFPISYGLGDYMKRKKINLISIFGIVSPLFTGGLALLRLEGIWFAIKEAAFPALVGLLTIPSAFLKKPFVVRFLIYNETVLNLPLIEARLVEYGAQGHLDNLFRRSSLFFSSGLLAGGAGMFVLAMAIFEPISKELSVFEQTHILNRQVARMIWMSNTMVILPMMLFGIWIVYHLLNGLRKYTHLDMHHLLMGKFASVWKWMTGIFNVKT